MGVLRTLLIGQFSLTTNNPLSGLWIKSRLSVPLLLHGLKRRNSAAFNQSENRLTGGVLQRDFNAVNA